MAEELESSERSQPDSPKSFQPSKLGTLEYWDKLYSEEKQVFEEHGYEGEIWFGEDVEQDMVKWLSQSVKLQNLRILELGCGNAHFWQTLSHYCRDCVYVGIDYSPNAIDLATKYLTSVNLYSDQSTILLRSDITQDDSRLASLSPFSVILDKGTFDAISLNPETENKRRYLHNVKHLLEAKCGLFMIVSCNWTALELQTQFEPHGFQLHATVERKKRFSFGGQTGSDVTIVVFKLHST